MIASTFNQRSPLEPAQDWPQLSSVDAAIRRRMAFWNLCPCPHKSLDDFCMRLNIVATLSAHRLARTGIAGFIFRPDALVRLFLFGKKLLHGFAELPDSPHQHPMTHVAIPRGRTSHDR